MRAFDYVAMKDQKWDSETVAYIAAIREAKGKQELYLNHAPHYILQLHKILYGHSAKSIGGKFKNIQNYINATDESGKTYTLFTPLAPYETPLAMEEICKLCGSLSSQARSEWGARKTGRRQKYGVFLGQINCGGARAEHDL